MKQSKANKNLLNSFKIDSIEGMKESLNNEADINAEYGKNNETLLYNAVIKGNYNIAKFLLENGADVNKGSRIVYEGMGITSVQTPLMEASEQGDLAMVKLLLDYKSDVKKMNSDKITALHNAAKRNHLEVVKMLVDAGADIYIKNYASKGAYDLANDKGYKEICDVLEAAENKHKIEKIKVETGWKLIASQEIVCTTIKKKLGYILTEVFNFASDERTYMSICKNVENNQESHSIKLFDDFADKTKLLKAYDKLIETGGSADRQIIYSQVMGKKKL